MTDITPEEKQLAAKILQGIPIIAPDGPKGVEFVARIIHEAGTFVPKPEPTVGERVAVAQITNPGGGKGLFIFLTYFTVAESVSAKETCASLIGKLAALIDEQRADAAKEGAEKMREKCAGIFSQHFGNGPIFQRMMDMKV